MKTIWIATRVSCQPVNGMKADSLGVFSTEEDARATACDDIKKWREQWKDEGVEVDFDQMTAWFDYDPTDKCKWIITSCVV